MAANTKSEPSNAELKKLAQRVAKLKAEGKKWPEIMRTVKRPEIVKGPASGRRLLRQFNLTDSIVEQTRADKPKKAAPKKPATKKTTAKAGARKRGSTKTSAEGQRARRNQPRTSSGDASPVTVRHDPSIVKK